jgi:DME family drug/metabolite transporter
MDNTIEPVGAPGPEVSLVAPVHPEAHHFRRGIVLVGLATFAFSTTGIFIDRLFSEYHLSAVQISLSRSALVTAALAFFLFFKDRSQFRLSRQELPFYLVYGLIGIGFFNLVWNISVEVNRAAVATALIFCSPVFVAFGAWLLFKDKLRPVQYVAIALNLIGCGLVAGITDLAQLLQSPAGLLLGIGSGMCYAGTTLFGKVATNARRRSSATILFYTFFFATLGLLVYALFSEGPSRVVPTLDGVGWLLLVGLSVGPTLGGYGLNIAGLRYLPAALVSMLNTLEPPITALLAWLLLSQLMSGLQWLGTGLIMGGVMIMQAAASRASYRARKAQS